ncbi:MAG TPA: GtrA family protein [Acidimicrobiales bacterium]|nr:GtrA family protein [Acidimicrobiales bacterium]
MELDLDTAVAVPGGEKDVEDGSRSLSAPSTTFWRRPLVTRVVRYALGSVIASLVSLVAFVLVYGVFGALSPRQSSIAASLTGMVPAYFLNRNWAWGRRGRSHVVKEVIPYLAASVLGLLAAMWSVDAASSHVKSLTADTTLQVTLVAMAYIGTYGALWVVKFLFFNVLFGRSHQDPDVRAPV